MSLSKIKINNTQVVNVDDSPLYGSLNIISSNAVGNMLFEQIGKITKIGTTFDAATYVVVYLNITFKSGVQYLFEARVLQSVEKNWYVYLTINGNHTMLIGGSSLSYTKIYIPTSDVTGNITIRYGGIINIEVSILSGDSNKGKINVIESKLNSENELLTKGYISGTAITSVRGYNIVIPNFFFRNGTSYVINAKSSVNVTNNLHIYIDSIALITTIASNTSEISSVYTANQDVLGNITLYTADAGISVTVTISIDYLDQNNYDELIINSGAIPSIIKDLIDSAYIRFNKWNPGKNKIVFPVINDLHANVTRRNSNVISYACTYIANIFGSNFIANLGDLGADLDGSPITWNTDNVKDMLNLFSKYHAQSKIPIVFVKGNHESYYGYFTKNGYPQIPSTEINNYIIKEYLQNNLIRRFNNLVCPLDTLTYGYMDIEQYKIRVIFLDTDENSSETTTIGFSLNLMNWFVDTLSNIPELYTVIILEHRPISYYGLYRQGLDLIDPQPSDYDMWNSLIIEICKGFISRTSGSLIKDNLTATWNFTNVSASLTGIFCGHSHFDWNKKENNLNMIGLQGMGLSPSNLIPSWGIYQTPNSILIDIISICPSERSIKLFKIGSIDSTYDREFTY